MRDLIFLFNDNVFILNVPKYSDVPSRLFHASTRYYIVVLLSLSNRRAAANQYRLIDRIDNILTNTLY